MSDVMIQVQGLGKRYTIGRPGDSQSGRTLRDALAGWMAGVNPRRSRPRQAKGDPTFWALRDVSFEVRRGEVVGIIGRNGAGKSTLLKVLSRITEPTEGRASLRGRLASLLEVGTGFHPELSGRENIYLNGSILGMPRAEITRKFDEIVAFAETERFLDTPVKYYSSGMYARLAFAVAAHLDPEILIVDEVLSVGDAKFQRKCIGAMSGIAASGRTILYVSHNMGTVESLCTSAVLMEQGRVVASGPTAQVARQYTQAADVVGHMWRAATVGVPRGDTATLESIRATTVDGRPAGEFGFDDDIVITIEYLVARPLADLQVGVRISTTSGVAVTTTSNADGNRDLTVARGKGRHTEALRIPARQLMPGFYTLLVALHEPRLVVFDKVEDAIIIQVSEVNYPYVGDHRSGVVQIVSDWQSGTSTVNT